MGLGIAVGLVLFPFEPAIRFPAGIVAAWIGISQWGFFENTKIEQELRTKTNAKGELVGYVFKKNPTAMDAHAEIGILSIHSKKLVVVSEEEEIEILVKNVISITRQRNIHSLLFLGGWVVLSLADGAKFKLESRTHRTMWHSRKRTSILFEELRTWKNEKAPA